MAEAEAAVVVDFTLVLLAVAVAAVVVSKTAALFASSDSLAATKSLVGHPSSQALVAQHPRNGVSSWEHVYQSPVPEVEPAHA